MMTLTVTVALKFRQDGPIACHAPVRQPPFPGRPQGGATLRSTP